MPRKKLICFSMLDFIILLIFLLFQVSLPDGRIQTVTYHADHEGGFVADVTYEGTPIYPDPPAGGYGPYKGPGAYRGPKPVAGYPAPPPPAYNARR